MKLLLTLLLFICAPKLNAQVKFQEVTLEQAIDLAASSGKLVFAQFVSETCDQCNDVADVAMKDIELGKFLNEQFIPIKIDLDFRDREQFINTFNPQQALGSFFLSGNREVVYRYGATNSNPKEYFNIARKALASETEGVVLLKELQEEWINNPSNFIAMQKYLDKRVALGLPVDSLLEVYTDRLPADSLTSITTLFFIASHAPVIFSKAHQILNKDKQLFQQVWYSIPLQTRITINNRRCYKSLQVAIKEKSRSKANAVATFKAGTFQNLSEQARKVYDNQMLNYYKGVADTVVYLQKAVDYYDKYYMNLKVDSIYKKDSAYREELFKKTPSTLSNESAVGTGVTKTKTISFTTQAQFIAKELSAGAWLLYTSSSDKSYLNKALTWAQRGLDFSKDQPSLYDTYARLLYKTGEQNKAIEMQKTAIASLKKRNFNDQRYQLVLDAMLAKKTSLDHLK